MVWVQLNDACETENAAEACDCDEVTWATAIGYVTALVIRS